MSDQKQKDKSLNSNDEMTHDDAIAVVEDYARDFSIYNKDQFDFSRGFLSGEKSVYSSPEIRDLIEAAKLGLKILREWNEGEEPMQFRWIEEALTAIDRKRGEMGK